MEGRIHTSPVTVGPVERAGEEGGDAHISCNGSMDGECFDQMNWRKELDDDRWEL